MAGSEMMDGGISHRTSNASLVFLRVARFISGVGLIAAVFISWMFTLTFYNRLRIQQQREHYRHEVFEVQGAVYYPRSDGDSESYWLTGVVVGKEERCVPKLAEHYDVESREDLLSLYPVGSQFNVLYNPDETTMMIQGETLRVVHYYPGFWEREERIRDRLALIVLGPVPLALCLYLPLRSLHKRALGNHVQESASGD